MDTKYISKQAIFIKEARSLFTGNLDARVAFLYFCKLEQHHFAGIVRVWKFAFELDMSLSKMWSMVFILSILKLSE